MKTLITFLIITLAIISPLIAHFGFRLTKNIVRKTLKFNMISFFSILAIFTVCMWSGNTSVFAECPSYTYSDNMKFLAAALSTGLSCIGAGVAVAAASSSALGAISEDPEIMGKSLIFVALAEGIALYGLLISFMIIG